MRKLLLGLILAALASVVSAQTQIASTALCNHVTTESSTMSCSFTISGHPNRYLVLQVTNIRNSAGNHAISATYNGAAVSSGSPAGTCNSLGNGTLRTCYQFWKEAVLPAAGTYTMTVNSTTNDSLMTADIIEFWNVNQTTPNSGDSYATGNSQSPTSTTASAANNVVLGVVGWKNSGSQVTVNGGETLIYNDWQNTSTWPSQAASYEAGAASVAIDWSLLAGTGWCVESISINSAGTVPTATPTATSTPTATATPTATPTATATPTITPTPGPCAPNIANSETAPGTSTAGTTNTLTNFDIGGEPNRLVAVWIASTSTSANTLSNITFNGVAMTHMGGTQGGNSAGSFGMSGYYIKEADLPGAGSYTISETNSVNALTTLEATELYNVNQTTPQANSTNCTATDGHPTCTITSTATTSIVLDSVMWKSNNTATVDASQTQLTNQQDNSFQSISLATSWEAGASTVAMDWTLSGTTLWKTGGVSINGSASCVTPTPTNTPTQTFTPTATTTPNANQVNVAGARHEWTWGEYLFALLKGHIR